MLYLKLGSEGRRNSEVVLNIEMFLIKIFV